ncbi:hypothetical protein C8J35_103502 [Rhizobium sp. PP-F2F-G38]|nr:hypothetical protein C8J35_103502 [Rhizobium sp. PP-F2F-G38]
MPKNTVPADGEAMPIEAARTLADDIAVDVSDVATLVSTIHDLANDLPCVDGAGNYNRPLSDVIALLRIARDKAAQTSAAVDLIAEGR